MEFALTPPTKVTFIISVVLAVVAVVVHFANIALPVFPTHGFVILLLGYLVLLAGNLFHGV
jgi:hypothetical protein